MYCHKLERTVAAVAWEASAKISLLVLLALSLLDRRCCSSVYCSSTGWSTGSHPTESWVEQGCVNSGTGYVCLMGRKQLSHKIQTGKKTTKNNEKPTINVQKNNVSVFTCPF